MMHLLRWESCGHVFVSIPTCLPKAAVLWTRRLEPFQSFVSSLPLLYTVRIYLLIHIITSPCIRQLSRKMFWLQEHHIGIFDYINARFYYLSFCLFLVSCIASVLAAHHEDGKRKPRVRCHGSPEKARWRQSAPSPTPTHLLIRSNRRERGSHRDKRLRGLSHR